MSAAPLFAWKLISELHGFVAVVIAADADAARARLKAKLLLDNDKTDEQLDELFTLIDVARALRFDLDTPGVICWAQV